MRFVRNVQHSQPRKATWIIDAFLSQYGVPCAAATALVFLTRTGPRGIEVKFPKYLGSAGPSMRMFINSVIYA